MISGEHLPSPPEVSDIEYEDPNFLMSFDGSIVSDDVCFIPAHGGHLVLYAFDYTDAAESVHTEVLFVDTDYLVDDRLSENHITTHQ